MKRHLAVFASLLIVAALLLPVAAKAAPTAGSWSGWITDEACGAKGDKVTKAEHKACAEKCAKAGSALVLFNTGDKKLYKLDKQDVAKEHLGHEVTVTGTVDGDKIAVDSIAMKKAS